MPVQIENMIAPKLHYLYLKDYLEQFKLSQNRQKIQEYNEKMKKHIKNNKISEKFK